MNPAEVLLSCWPRSGETHDHGECDCFHCAVETTRLLDDAEIEARYGIKRGTLRAWRSRGIGPPFVRLTGRMPRYRIADVEDFLAARLVRADGSGR